MWEGTEAQLPGSVSRAASAATAAVVAAILVPLLSGCPDLVSIVMLLKTGDDSLFGEFLRN